MYTQGGGVEQATFDTNSGVSSAKTDKIVDWLSKINLPKNGKLLEVGCGNGAFLKSFSSKYPSWKLSGLELTNKNKATVEAIPGVSKLHLGQIEDLKEHFDIIVLFFVLEHIPDPVNYFKNCLKILNSNGLILIQVPNLEDSIFDILIADHCTHFSMESLEVVLKTSGLEIIESSSEILPKELTTIASKENIVDSYHSRDISITMQSDLISNSQKIVNDHIVWLKSLIKQGQNTSENIGIFGTSISATWLATSLGGEKVNFFIDEDPNRIGRTHMDKPIYGPEKFPDSVPILMPLIPKIARNIVSRHKDKYFILPPLL